MARSASLGDRVAWGAAAIAIASALFAATSTSGLAAYLLLAAEDRRLTESARVLAVELATSPPEPAAVNVYLQDELVETARSGIHFAILDRAGNHLAGDRRATPIAADHCADEADGALRACGARSDSGLLVVALSTYATPTSLLALSALAAAVLAGVIAWLASRPLSRLTVAPLSRLRARLDDIDLEVGTSADLGPPTDVAEVEQLRGTIASLLVRSARSLDQAQRFAANAAHELRTPLTTIRAELELLAEETELADETATSLARVQRKVAELHLLVERLLILATPKDPGVGSLEIVSIRDLLEDFLETLAPADRARVSVTADDSQIHGDAVLLGTLVANALSNALKFGAAVRASAKADGSLLRLCVQDDGPGLDEGEEERVFEPMVRAQRALREGVPGHGLGLALVRHIATSHGGSAAFIDPAREGCRLEILLPLAPPRAP